ncbi:hypothetical protein CLOM_g12410 [Closterium sp. NIES-68]|nr:hypothetical protein CLOM_g12410 [Closterium sp. NIES-68]
MLERVAFNQGMDELVNSGFGLEGIVTDEGNTYSGAANERGVKHQVDWWHKCGSVVRNFREKVQDATRKAGTVDGAIESDAKYLHLELQQVVRLERGVRTANNTGRGEVPREQGAGAVGGDAPEESESDRNGGMAEGGTERMPDAMVRWSDVEELWDGDVHPVRGIRPHSHASMLLVQAWNGIGEGRHFMMEDDQVPNTNPGNQAHMGGGDMDVEGEENNRQGSGADENVDPAAGTQQQSGRRWGRRAPRRRTRRGCNAKMRVGELGS